MHFTLAAALLLGLIGCAVAEERALVLIDNPAVEQTHSAFFGYLQDTLGIRVRFMQAGSSNVNFMKYDQAKYEHLIIFAPSASEFGGGIKAEDVIEFVDQGRNVLIATDSQSGSAANDVAALCGIEVDGSQAFVIDHVNNAGSSTLVKASKLVDSELIVGKKSAKPILYRGVGLSADSNPLLIPILRGNPTSYSFNPAKSVDEYPHAVGTATLLVAGVQARNNARVVVSGSIELFSNEFFANEQGANKQFAEALAAWVFKFNGVIRIGAPSHHLVGQTSPPREYTVGEELTFSVDAEERVNGKWVPFTGKDVQLEFVRIDPFVRTYLLNDNGHLHVTFKAPDVYGVFQFKIDYKRTGYTFIESQTQAVVRPLLHTQYDRFIPAAYPYYASAFSMLFGLFVFSFVFLYHRA